MANTDNFDPKSVKKLTAMEILKRVGPGIIMTGIVIGPGNITTSAMLGANYGYDMIWIIIPIILMAIIFMMVSYRISMLTGMPLLHAIRHYYGNAAAAFCGVCLFLTCFFFTMGNVSGTGAGMHLLFGIDWKIGAGIMLVVLIIVYFAKNVYSKIEIGITICIIAMIVAFYVTLVGVGGPDWGQLGHGLTHWNFNNGSLTTALAYISTNASVTAGIYGTYLGLEKKWKKEDLFNGALLADAITHVVLVVLISGAIVLVGAIVLNPTGTAATDDFSSNMMRPHVEAGVVPAEADGCMNYLLTKDEAGTSCVFRPSSGRGTFKANRAYLAIPNESGAKFFSITFEDDVTGIKNVNGNANANANSVVYDLQGRKVADKSSSLISHPSSRKGVYIVNGKKIVIK